MGYDIPEDHHGGTPGEIRAAQAAKYDGSQVHDPKTKPTNPKDAIGSDKLPLDLVPETAIALASLAHLDGALKYGKWNWRVGGVRASVYIAAARRHLMAYANGEDMAPDGVHHLGHLLACINILIDAEAVGKLRDDRPPTFNVSSWMEKLVPWVKTLRARHADKTPRHWTIKDPIEPN